MGSLAVDRTHIYGINATGEIARADLDGTAIDRVFTTHPLRFGNIGGLAVADGHIYWTNWTDYPDGGIGRAKLDGTAINESFISGLSIPGGLAADRGHLYWTRLYEDRPAGAIGRANIDGTRVAAGLIRLPKEAYGIAVDAAHVYWTTPYWTYATPNTAPIGPSIGRANLDGTGVNETLISGSSAYSIAVDSLSHRSPKTKITKGVPRKSDTRKVRFKFKSSRPHSTFECRLDKTAWRACVSPKKVKDLDRGQHKFRVRAIDPAGNVDPTPARDSFKVVG